MPPPCLLLPIPPGGTAHAFLWVLIWPSPNLRTHLEYREHLEPPAAVITTPPPGVDSPDIDACRRILQRADHQHPSTLSREQAALIVQHCCIDDARGMLELDRDSHLAYAVARARDGYQRSPRFPLEVLDALSPVA